MANFLPKGAKSGFFLFAGHLLHRKKSLLIDFGENHNVLFCNEVAKGQEQEYNGHDVNEDESLYFLKMKEIKKQMTFLNSMENKLINIWGICRYPMLDF